MIIRLLMVKCTAENDLCQGFSLPWCYIWHWFIALGLEKEGNCTVYQIQSHKENHFMCWESCVMSSWIFISLLIYYDKSGSMNVLHLSHLTFDYFVYSSWNYWAYSKIAFIAYDKISSIFMFQPCVVLHDVCRLSVSKEPTCIFAYFPFPHVSLCEISLNIKFIFCIYVHISYFFE